MADHFIHLSAVSTHHIYSGLSGSSLLWLRSQKQQPLINSNYPQWQPNTLYRKQPCAAVDPDKLSGPNSTRSLSGLTEWSNYIEIQCTNVSSFPAWPEGARSNNCYALDVFRSVGCYTQPRCFHTPLLGSFRQGCMGMIWKLAHCRICRTVVHEAGDPCNLLEWSLDPPSPRVLE